MSKVTVFGAGAWGSTMAQVLSDAGNEVLLWGRSAEVIAEINSAHTNKKYLQQHILPDAITASTDLAEAFKFSNIYILAIPAQQLRSTLVEWKGQFSNDCTIVSTLKGIEISTQMRMTEVIEDVLGPHRVAIITGPNLADELVLRQPAGAVVAAPTMELAEQIRDLFRTPYYRVYTSIDVMGCELSGAIKSVIALAVGISIGMGSVSYTHLTLPTNREV